MIWVRPDKEGKLVTWYSEEEMKLNFTISELLKSDTAKKYGIKNMPSSPEIYDNLLMLITECLQPLRNYIGKPIIITSGYRTQLLNQKIGGVDTSQHCKGQAADFIIKGMSIPSIIEAVKRSGVEYDQCINEYSQWVHISYNKGKNRKQCFNIT